MIAIKNGSKKVIIVLLLLFVLVLSYIILTNKKDTTSNTEINQPEETEPITIDPITEPEETEPSLPVYEQTPLPPTPKPSQVELDKIDISDWKTYTNDQHGYEIKYPSDWSVGEREDYQVHFLSPGNEEFHPEGPGAGNIFIIMYTPRFGGSAPETYYSKSNITIDGIVATKYDGIPGGQDPQYPNISITEVYFVYNEDIMSMEFPDDIEIEGDEDYISIYYKMLETLRFTK